MNIKRASKSSSYREKKKILLFGATGMAGHVIFKYLYSFSEYAVISASFREKLTEDTILIDASSKEKVEQFCLFVKPDIIVNAIGVLINGAYNSPSNAIYINAFLPHFLSDCARKIGAKLIHLSTDCVFSGGKGQYVETDRKDAEDVYGQSKALGEVINDRDLTIRTSIIGPELKKNGEGLLHWFFNQKGEIKGFSHVFWSGVSTLELAHFIDFAIKNNLTGLCHLTNGVSISKLDLLTLLKDVFLRDQISIIDDPIKRSNKSFINTRKDYVYAVPSYIEMIQEMKKMMCQSLDLYLQYEISS